MGIKRLAELCLLFVALPLLIAAVTSVGYRFLLFLFLWPTALGCYLVLRADREFRTEELISRKFSSPELRRVLVQFAVIALLLSLIVYSLLPELFLRFPRARPGLWAMVLLLYPPLSAYPQGLIYRSFFLHRYAAIFDSPRSRIIASATFFSFMHIVFLNYYALALTFPGGLLFSYTHERTKSLLASTLEHALYGLLLITLGLGVFLVSGSYQLTCRAFGECLPGYFVSQ